MKLHQPSADIFIPDSQPVELALARVTHLGIGAHQDDLEFMAFHGILQCFQTGSRWFGGVTCTNGGGSARSGPYATFSDADMQRVRRDEQRAAAVVGQYAGMIQLDYPSATLKNPAEDSLQTDLVEIFQATRPEIVYTHNLADKHDTHIAVAINVIHALRALPAERRPAKLLGCEVWRGLDWLLDSDKTALDVSAHENLAAALNGIFDSQIAGGKRYDLASLGRRRANATFFESHATDQAAQLAFALDLTPLIADDQRDIVAYVGEFIHRFETDVRQKLSRQLGRPG